MIRILFLLLMIAVFSGCRKYLEVLPPDDRVISGDVFVSDAKALAALSGIYGSLVNGPGLANGQVTVFAGYSGGELARFNPAASEEEFMQYALRPENAVVQSLWSGLYKHVYYANACLEGLQRATSLSPAVQEQLMGEAYFIRAWCYFYLTRFFGAVPLLTTTDHRVNAGAPRTAVPLVEDGVIRDLLQAQRLLPAAFAGGERTRPTAWAATALLARVYLFRRDWAAAETQASTVLNSSLFGPLPALGGVFLKSSREAIWQLQSRIGYVPEVQQILPSAGQPRVILTAACLQAFEGGDQRRRAWVDSITVGTLRYHYPGKYKASTATNTEYCLVLRAAEQYLIRAEARAQLNLLPEGLQDLNAVRARAGLPPHALLSKAALLQAIARERQVELFGEWGHRWFDLRRRGETQAVLGGVPGWSPTDELYPVPQSERLLNPSLDQNPGY